MRLTCSACNAENSLETMLGREADARAFAAFMERHVVFGSLLVRYIALFRPPKRRLGIARMLALVDELLPDIERGAINRKSRDWAAPRDNWRAALETVIAKRDDNSLILPLTTHGLLYEVLVATAERYERRSETEQLEQHRQNRPAGAAAAPRNLADAVVDLIGPKCADVVLVPPALMPPAYTGPSRAALAIRAQNEAARRQRNGAPDDTDIATGAP